MKTVILWNEDMPVTVSDSYINDYLMRGYTENPPIQSIIEEKSETQSSVVSLNINSDSLTVKQLTGMLGVTAAIAKKTLEDRPYLNLVDLSIKVPGFKWETVSQLIKFQQ